MMNKLCSRCKQLKPLSDFSKDRYKKDGLNVSCRVCIKLKPPRIVIIKTHKTCKICNTDHPINHFRGLVCMNCIIDRREHAKSQKAPRVYSTVTHSIYTRNKRKSNPVFRLRSNIGSLIATSLANGGFKKTSKTADILGCTFEEFTCYIESQFAEGMTWSNRHLWHLDHIVPISRAQTIDQILLLNHYTNFRPLWAKDNQVKAGKLTEDSLAHPLITVVKSNHGED